MPLADLEFSKGVPVLPPAHSCMICDRKIEETGGRRLIAQPSRGTTLFDHAIKGGFNNFHSCEKLLDDRGLFLILWGEKTFLTQKAIKRVRQDYLAGYRPWFCQGCGYRLCSVCGALLPRPVASDYIYDDGGTVHCPILGADPGCWNPQCSKFRNTSKPYPGWFPTA